MSRDEIGTIKARTASPQTLRFLKATDASNRPTQSHDRRMGTETTLMRRQFAMQNGDQVARWQQQQQEQAEMEGDFVEQDCRSLRTRFLAAQKTAAARARPDGRTHRGGHGHWIEDDTSDEMSTCTATGHGRSSQASSTHSRSHSSFTDDADDDTYEDFDIAKLPQNLKQRLVLMQERRAAGETLRRVPRPPQPSGDTEDDGLAIESGRLKLRNVFARRSDNLGGQLRQHAGPPAGDAAYGEEGLILATDRHTWRAVSSPTRVRQRPHEYARAAIERSRATVRHTRAKTCDDGLEGSPQLANPTIGLSGDSPVVNRTPADLEGKHALLHRFAERDPPGSCSRDRSIRKRESTTATKDGRTRATARGQRQRERGTPNLIANLNSMAAPKTVKDMQYDPVQKVWNGNAEALDVFRQVDEPPRRPVLIRGAPTTEQASQKLGGTMVFDTAQMRWITRNGEAEADPFDGMSSDEESPDMHSSLHDRSFGTIRTSSRGNPSVLSGSTMEEFPVGEEFDVGPSFIRRQRDADRGWRTAVAGWTRPIDASQRHEDMWELFRLLHD